MPKRIVICSDGTWNRPTQKHKGVVCPTNVFKIKQAIAPYSKDGWPQVVFYDEGIGARGLWVSRITRGATGLGLKKNIEDAYRFVMDNYAEGDQLFFFGFSRGAYTVRSTAGLLRKCGLLRREHADKFDEAYDFYRVRGDDTRPSAPRSEEFRRKHSLIFSDATTDMQIKFIGVWDTVGALGIPLFLFGWVNKLFNLEFHDLQLSSKVENAFQALAIDEFRRPFMPALWDVDEPVEPPRRLEQVWFSGAHSNVGGGYQHTGLSDITLLWMMKRAEESGLAFEPEYTKHMNIRPDPFGALVNSRTFLYWFSRRCYRLIGYGGDSKESLAQEVYERYKNDKRYRPRNLEKFLSLHSHIPEDVPTHSAAETR